MNTTPQSHLENTKTVPVTPPPSQTSRGFMQPASCSATTPTVNASPKSNNPRQVITDFHWAQYLAPYDQLAEANFELPRVPHVRIDLEKGTVYQIKPDQIKPKPAETQKPADATQASGSVRGSNVNDNSDILVIDRAAVEATKRNEALKTKEVMERIELTRTPSVKRTILRKKL